MNELLRPLDAADEVQYYKEVVKRAGSERVEVKQTTDGKGKGIFATKDIQAGQSIFLEAPKLAQQHVMNKDGALVCSHCFCFIGSIELQAAWQLRQSPDGKLAEASEGLQQGSIALPCSSEFPLPNPVACHGRCDELYCSQQCADMDWSEHHSLLCTGDESPCAKDHRKLHHLSEFKHHAEETNDIFLLAAKVIAFVLLQARTLASNKVKTGEALKQAWQPFAAGWKNLWWESVATPDDVTDEAAFRLELKTLAEDSLELLKGALHDDNHADMFDLDVYGSLVGMFELNNLGFSIPSPLAPWLESLTSSSTPEVSGQPSASSKSDAVCEVIKDAVADALEEGASCEGTGFYALQSCANHSCDPNTALECKNDSRCQATAKRSIAAGEEITISYIDEDGSLAERQKDLLDYGFTCQCLRCLKEGS